MTTNCGTTLAGGASCSINVSYAPTLYGDAVAYVVVNFGNGQSFSIPLLGDVP